MFISLWVAHPVGMGLDFIMTAPLLPSHYGFSFDFGRGVSFLCVLQHLPVNDWSIVVISELSQEEVSAHPSSPPS